MNTSFQVSNLQTFKKTNKKKPWKKQPQNNIKYFYSFNLSDAPIPQGAFMVAAAY